jgi:hypothetical protein
VPRSSSEWVSATSSHKRRPCSPPAALTSSMASRSAASRGTPEAARDPEKGRTAPMRMASGGGLDCAVEMRATEPQSSEATSNRDRINMALCCGLPAPIKVEMVPDKHPIAIPPA